jgi:uncharacterized protein YndB with AHSA1/START domain
MAAGTARNNARNPVAREDLVMTRVFDVPRALMFKLWVDPRHLRQWWGPKGFSNPRCEFEAKPGGAIHIDMRGPDGTIYPMSGVVDELAEPERIVFTSTAHGQDGEPALEVLTTVTFAESAGKTKLTMRAHVVNATEEGLGYLEGMEAGWTQSFDRLGGHVDTVTMRAASNEIVATRVFDAPKELIWKLWTEPDHIAKWWGPEGFTNTIERMDVRPGGMWKFVMRGPDGVDYENEIVYVEVARPDKIVYDHVSYPRFRSTSIFETQGEQTRVSVRVSFDSAELRNKAADEFHAVEGLWQTLGRLEQQLILLG